MMLESAVARAFRIAVTGAYSGALFTLAACGADGAAPIAAGGSAGSGGSSASSSAGQTSVPRAGETHGAAGSSSTAGQGGGGAAGQAGSASGGSASGGEAGNSGGGQSGAGGSSGEGGSAGGPQVTAPKARHEHRFRAKDADSAASFNDNAQVAVVDNRAPTLLGKLVLPFGGLGTNAGTLEAGGEFCARRGFHVLGVAAFQDYDIVSHGADFFGNARRSVFEGVLHTQQGAFAGIDMTPADGVAQRVQKGLQYLQQQFPAEGWGYFLGPDGSVRWSDVIFSGFSHGGSNAARFAFLVEASRAVSFAAPRENTCTQLDLANCGGMVATWLSEVPKTPLDRFYAITGQADQQNLQHLFAMAKIGYPGAATPIDEAQPPYGNSHRLVADTGHTDFCQLPSYQAVCNYVFGVPPENQAGTAG